MNLVICECCLKPQTACDCLGPRSIACDFCGKDIVAGEAFYESRACRRTAEFWEECGEDSAVLSCESCEVIRMQSARWLKWVSRFFRGFRS